MDFFIPSVTNELEKMSLFKTREWWSYQTEEKEIYSPEGLVVTTGINKDFPGSSLVVSGSLGGTLRVFDPSLSSQDASNTASLLLEVFLPQPVIKILAGQFTR